MVGATVAAVGEEAAMGTVDKVLAEHVTLRVRSVDRLGIAGYIPTLQFSSRVAGAVLVARRGVVGTRPSCPVADVARPSS
jgi:hypothetical protein